MMFFFLLTSPIFQYTVDQFAPFFQRSVGGHDGGAKFISSHNYLEQILSRLLGQFLVVQVIDYQKADFKIAVHGFDPAAKAFGLADR